jgi:hypothetical protein
VKKFAIAIIAIVMALVIAPAALAGSLVPALGAGANGYGTGNYSITTNGDGSVTLTTGQDGTATPNDYARLAWISPTTGYPANLTLGNLAGVSASVTLTAGTDAPFYLLGFTDPSDSFLGTTGGDQILLIEFQPSTISGGSMVADPNATLFNLYDNTLGVYLLSGQADVNTLAAWIALDPSLSDDALQQIRIGIGLSGGDTPAESLTVYSADVSQITPEPSSLWLLGTGLLGLAVVVLRKA